MTRRPTEVKGKRRPSKARWRAPPWTEGRMALPRSSEAKEKVSPKSMSMDFSYKGSYSIYFRLYRPRGKVKYIL